MDMWSILNSKAEGEAEETLETCTQGVGLWAYLRTQSDRPRKEYETSGTHAPPTCNHEHEISLAVTRWEEKCTRKGGQRNRSSRFWTMTTPRMMLRCVVQKSVEY